MKFFQKQIGADTIKQIRKISFCGNDGDPIYCKDFLEICDWIKSVNPTIHLVLITNGSYKPESWWQDIAGIFDERDEIHWSLDGWSQESNEQYRVNSDWASIEQGFKTFFAYNTSTYRIWASIAFKFNEQHIEHQKIHAIAHGFDCYQLTKSTKFSSKYPIYGIIDPLEPTQSNLVAAGHRFERAVESLSPRARPGQELKEIFLQRAINLNNVPYSGICLIGNKGVFLTSQGEFYPCCWTANRYDHNKNWHELAQEKFNLNARTFTDIINDPFWTSEFLKFDSLECQTKCTRDKLLDKEHITEW